MPQSLSQVIVHIVFSTKDRQKWLDAAISPRMHAYLATVCRHHDCEAYRFGGVVAHVHLAVRLGRTISQAGLIETIKTSSSAWIKKQGDAHRSFFWQRGYGAFSVGFSQLDSFCLSGCCSKPQCIGSDLGEVRGTAYLLVMRRFASGPEAEQRLERSHR